jgi:ABC-type multidrug transport system permease subunit
MGHGRHFEVGHVQTLPTFPWLTGAMYVGLILFFAIAVLVVVVFAVSVKRRRQYERGEYEPND